MIAPKSLVAYKTRPALVIEQSADKIVISVPSAGKAGEGKTEYKVREKDVEFLHPGPVADINALGDMTVAGLGLPADAVRGAWELLEDTAHPAGAAHPAAAVSGGAVPLKELAELAWGSFSAESAWGSYLLLLDGLYFTGDIGAIRAKTAAEVEAEEKKRSEKQQDARDRGAFLDRLRARKPDLPSDGRFLQDVEALAYGKTEKSRTLKECGLSETPQDAHRLLLETGFWTPFVNPHPVRFGLPLYSAKIPLGLPPEEDRVDLRHLAAFAVDNAWSADPDDAVSLEPPGPQSPGPQGCPADQGFAESPGRQTLWVHVADPAAALLPGSPAEREARNRGATFYLPEGVYRMIAEEALPRYALGLSEKSPALSFKMVLNEDGSIAEADVLRSWVRVTRLTYEEADTLAASAAGGASDVNSLHGAVMARLFALAERNLKRRMAAGAISIDLPEAHITVSDEKVSINPEKSYKSADMVRECMLLAGEGAAWWAGRGVQQRNSGKILPFPYVTQEIGDLPDDPLPGLAGSWQLRRCMRPRSLSAKPGLHQGLGLDVYTQVTSPLRRYTDLLAHQQIRAVLRGEPPLDEDELLLRLMAGEAAASASVQAERASKAHWTAVYLADKIGSQWEAVVMERKGPKTAVLIPALALDTLVSIKGDPEPNDPVTLTLVSVRIPWAEAIFQAEKG
ncbi:exoribonuclease II [Spirochaetia bacterium]|nr:exoribonuclease II [Spirochaetia bacterium]